MLSVNRSAKRDYELFDTLEAGLVLHGSEVKSAKKSGVRLKDAYVKMVGGEPHLINGHISPYKQASHGAQHKPDRSRKLLLHRKEIIKLQSKLSQKPNLTMIPLKCYEKKGLIKCEIALAKRRKDWQVKKVEQNRDEKRRVEKEIREKMKG